MEATDRDTPAPDSQTNRVVSLQNRCNESKSPYVRAHASNATAWQLWEPATLELARRVNRPLFLSIGYSACHWCHVMARDSFADDRVAQLLNERFIPVKVDREERPDIDRQYMDYLQAFSGAGGWPLNVFLTPDLQPFFGGTYWPQKKTESASSAFEEVLIRVSDAWRAQEARCRQSGRDAVRQLREFAQEGNLGGRPDEAGKKFDDGNQDFTADGPELDVLEDSYEHFQSRYDPTYGGFAVAPKFPTPTHLRHLLRLGSYAAAVREIIGETDCAGARSMAVHTMECMARGAIKDQIGHGFARYSVSRDWNLPHFEKMLCDNALLLQLYVEAYLLTRSPLFLDIAQDIATYLTSSPIASSLGGFHASEDADSLLAENESQTREGAFYVWKFEELKTALAPEEFAVCSRYWGVSPKGNIDQQLDAHLDLAGRNVLHVQYQQPADLASELGMSTEAVVAAIERGRKKLLSARDASRPRPALDDKLIVAWNGLAISALAQAGAALARPEYIAAAESAASCIKQHLYNPDSHTLLRIYRDGPGTTPAFADDYAFFIASLLDLYETTGHTHHLQQADILQQTQLSLFWDPKNAAFFSTPANQPDILVRTKDGMDTSEPSINSVSASNLFRLSSLLSDKSYAAHARATVAAFDVEIATHPGLFSGTMPAVVAARLGVRCLVLPPAQLNNQTVPQLTSFTRKLFYESVIPNISILQLPSSSSHPNVAAEESERWLRTRNASLSELESELATVSGGNAVLLVDESGERKVLRSEADVRAVFT